MHDVARELDRLVKKEVIRPKTVSSAPDQKEYRFHHALVRDARPQRRRISSHPSSRATRPILQMSALQYFLSTGVAADLFISTSWAIIPGTPMMQLGGWSGPSGPRPPPQPPAPPAWGVVMGGFCERGASMSRPSGLLMTY